MNDGGGQTTRDDGDGRDQLERQRQPVQLSDRHVQPVAIRRTTAAGQEEAVPAFVWAEGGQARRRRRGGNDDVEPPWSAAGDADVLQPRTVAAAAETETATAGE